VDQPRKIPLGELDQAYDAPWLFLKDHHLEG
jgi:hypothetical protein